MADVSKFVLGGSTGVELNIKDATARESIETIETDLTNKADVATSLSGYGITDAYTQTEVDTLLSAKQDALTFDDEPTEDSTNPVTSGGVYDAVNDLSSEISDLTTEVDSKIDLVGSGTWYHTAVVTCDLSTAGFAYLFTTNGILKLNTSSSKLGIISLNDGELGGYFSFTTDTSLTQTITVWSDSEHTTSRSTIWRLIPMNGTWSMEFS